MNVHRISILLEVISFFLVTLDLFGKERLGMLYRRIITNLNRIRQVEFERWSHKWLLSPFIFFGAILMTASLVYIIYNFLPLFVAQFPHSMPFLIGCLIVVIAIYAYIKLLVLIYVRLLYYILLLASVILNLLTRLFNRYKLEGLMLTIGTILFIIGKSIEFFVEN